MGNYVMIDHGGGVISRLFHLMRASVTVKPGQAVAQGQLLGKVGFSGSVYTIHTHYEVGTGTGMDAEGLPLYVSRFRRVWGSRSTAVRRGPIDSGDLIEQP
jgi:murein DD-endopeptidase MepM/ murein hydrolase activator NlpD